MNKALPKSGKQQDDEPDYALEEQIGFLLRRAHQRASAIFQQVFEEQSLTPQQFAVLAKLYEVGEVTQNKLGRLVDMDPASMQGVIQRLKLSGLIKRVQDPLHKRRLKVQLSPGGKRLVKNCFSLGLSVSEQTLAPLDGTQQRDLIKLLKAITEQPS